MQARMGLQIHDPRNIVLMHARVLKKFDGFRLAIIPQEESPNDYQVGMPS